MGRQSSIALLPPEVREQLERLIRDGRSTIDEIVAEIQAMGGDVKRTAVGNFKHKMEVNLQRVREAQEVAGVWTAKLGENRDSPMGQLVAEVIKTVAFRTITDLDQDGKTVDPEDLMLLAKALQGVSAAQKADHDFRRKLRDEFVAEAKARATAAADQVSTQLRTAGLSEDAAAAIRKQILGIPG